MGCDIHAFIEYKKPGSDNWLSYSSENNLDRHYGVFAALADVRNRGSWGVKPLEVKGFPADASCATTGKYTLFITDETNFSEGYASREDAKRWVDSGCSKLFKDSWVTDPDAHTPSWVVGDELESALNEKALEATPENSPEYFVTLMVLREFEKLGFESRLIFWFDN